MPISPDNINSLNNGVVITSRLFHPVDFPSTTGVSYLDGNILNRYRVVIDFYTLLSFEDKLLTFDAATKTITNSDVSNGTNFISAGWKAGMTIAVEGTGQDGTFTITNVAARVITVAEVLSNEVATNASLFDDTPVTDLDFYYNLIENSEIVNYLSKTDRDAIQRFTFTGLNASDTGTTVNALVASRSFGWVTNTLTDVDTGETDEVTIIGAGITDHKQAFTLTQEFTVNPIWTRGLFTNFNNETPPDYFAGTRSLKHVFKLDAKFSNNPDVPFTGGITNVSGLNNWFNGTNIKTRPDYYFESITYTDQATSTTTDRIDINRLTDCLVTVKSKSGLFVTGGSNTAMVLDIWLCPQDETEYVDTETTLRQNIANDRLRFDLANGSTNGEYFGTSYQVLTNIVPTYVDAFTATVAFTVDFSTELRTLLKSRDANDRIYAISITTQDEAISDTVQTDRTTILCAFENAAYNQNDDTLLELVNNKFKIYNFPYIDQHPQTIVSGFEGEPVYAQFPFRVETNEVGGVIPTLTRAGLQIVATKTGEEDFVIEEKIFNTQFTRRLCDVQDINITDTRNFKTTEDDPYNTNSLTREPVYDSGTMKGFAMQYAFALRYEYWLSIIQNAERFQFPLFDRCTTDVTQAWKTIADDGWELQLKFIGDVKGYDGYTTTFNGYTDINIIPASSVSETKYYNENGIQVDAIVKGGYTKIITTITGDYSTFPTGYDGLFAYVFADLPNTGSINNRRFASTEFDSETDNPFIYVKPDKDATSSIVSENVTINVFGTSYVTIETWYDDTKQNWGIQNEDILFSVRFGYKLVDNFMLFEDGSTMNYDDGSPMLYEHDALT